jgi:hypothetical protein
MPWLDERGTYHSVMWDDEAQCYRSTLPHKLVFGLGAGTAQWFMLRFVSPDTAHRWAFPMIRLGSHLCDVLEALWPWPILAGLATLLIGTLK